MGFQIILLIVFVILSSGLMFWYYKTKNALVAQHFSKTSNLKTAIAIHQKQIAYRTSSLNKYDFVKYNLNEALVIQADIKL